MNEQEFSERLADAGWNKKKLVQMLHELDEAKRRIKSTLRRYAHDPDCTTHGNNRKTMERKLKDKEGYLIERREIVRSRLGEIKKDQKSKHKAESSKGNNYSDAFVAAAERLLPEETFAAIELRAVGIIQSE